MGKSCTLPERSGWQLGAHSERGKPGKSRPAAEYGAKSRACPRTWSLCENLKQGSVVQPRVVQTFCFRFLLEARFLGAGKPPPVSRDCLRETSKTLAAHHPRGDALASEGAAVDLRTYGPPVRPVDCKREPPASLLPLAMGSPKSAPERRGLRRVPRTATVEGSRKVLGFSVERFPDRGR